MNYLTFIVLKFECNTQNDGSLDPLMKTMWEQVLHTLPHFEIWAQVAGQPDTAVLIT
jgi:hypothetical protein